MFWFGHTGRCGSFPRLPERMPDGHPSKTLEAEITGVGRCSGHHGELLQGAFPGPAGGLVRALVTLPFPVAGTVAMAELSPDPAEVAVCPPDRAKAAFAARLTLGRLGLRRGVRVILRGGMPAGWGLGSSTADVVATVRAVGSAAGVRLPAATVARLAVAAEGATDPLMFGGAVPLFGQRTGRVVRMLGDRLPPLHVVGCNPGGVPVDTLRHPPAVYSVAELRELARLATALERAVRQADVPGIGAVATASARLNQRFLPSPRLEELLALGTGLGAAGIQVAHSGTVAGLIFTSARAAAAGQQALTGFGATWRFAVNAAPTSTGLRASN